MSKKVRERMQTALSSFYRQLSAPYLVRGISTETHLNTSHQRFQVNAAEACPLDRANISTTTTTTSTTTTLVGEQSTIVETITEAASVSELLLFVIVSTRQHNQNFLHSITPCSAISTILMSPYGALRGGYYR